MAAKPVRHDEREEAREGVNALRFLGGLLLTVGLLLFFFHLAEKPMGRHTLGWLAALFVLLGAGLIGIGWRRLRAMR